MKAVPWEDIPTRDQKSSSSADSDQSTRTKSTLPTEYSGKTFASPYVPNNKFGDIKEFGLSRRHTDNEPRVSVMTYESTNPSDDEESEIDPEDSYEVIQAQDKEYLPEAIASNPKDFAHFFPSSRRISIQHDDATIDGNMNLRLDTLVDTLDGKKITMTLFHLRMHDLKSRDFSLRRYCRDSGREVCRSGRKYHQPSTDARPGLQTSISSALATLKRQSSTGSPRSPTLTRTDSGNPSPAWNVTDLDNHKSGQKDPKRPTNKIKLEFSNYAHVEVKRQGKGPSKRYNFFYWGVKYSWRRVVKQEGDFTEVSYHLVKEGNKLPSAHIVPATLTKSQASEEYVRGGWVPPCSLWIKDDEIIESHPDVADVVIATGLMALVDDSIKSTWPPKRRRPFILPLFSSPSIRLDLEYIGPRKLINQVFNRGANSNRPKRSTPRRCATT